MINVENLKIVNIQTRLFKPSFFKKINQLRENVVEQGLIEAELTQKWRLTLTTKAVVKQ